MAMQNFFNLLPGDWYFSRKIINFYNNTNEIITGNVVLKKLNKTALLYSEKGVRHIGIGNINFTQNYRYELDADSNSINIYFVNFINNNNKNKIFVRLSALSCDAIHLCGQDCYVVKLIIPDNFGPHNKCFDLQHTVTGPKKNYQMITQYKLAI